MSEVFELAPSARIWFRGGCWEVVALHGSDVTLRSGERMQRVLLDEIAAGAVAMESTGPRADPAAVVWSSLSASQRRKLEERTGHVRSVLTEVGEGQLSLLAAMESEAAAVGVSVRTLERWVGAYRRAGVAGLADTRVRSRYAGSVDSRWDAACLRVLDSYIDASTPTTGAVIDVVARELAAAYGPGVVPLPGRSVAYQRLKALSKGRHAFGSSTGRPQARQLTPTRRQHQRRGGIKVEAPPCMCQTRRRPLADPLTDR